MLQFFGVSESRLKENFGLHNTCEKKKKTVVQKQTIRIQGVFVVAVLWKRKKK